MVEGGGDRRGPIRTSVGDDGTGGGMDSGGRGIEGDSCEVPLTSSLL